MEDNKARSNFRQMQASKMHAQIQDETIYEQMKNSVTTAKHSFLSV